MQYDIMIVSDKIYDEGCMGGNALCGLLFVQAGKGSFDFVNASHARSIYCAQDDNSE